jgi:hypothetical protein
MSLPPEMMRTLEDLRADFESALAEKNWELAKQIRMQVDDWCEGLTKDWDRELLVARREDIEDHK